MTTATQRFIEKAIEGGWVSPKPSKLQTTYETENGTGVRLPCIWLDPKSWEAVGKVEGWTEVNQFGLHLEDVHRSSEARRLNAWERNPRMPEWKWKMHRMIDALASGQSVEEYLATIV